MAGRGLDRRPRKPRTDGHKPPAPGPGRPLGSTDALPNGAVGAIRALRYRIPEGTPDEVIEIADRALGTVVAVMDGSVHRDVLSRLSAAKYVREEVCGAIPQRHEVSVIDNLADRLRKARERVSRG